MKTVLIYAILITTSVSCVSPHFAPYKYETFIVIDTVDWVQLKSTTLPVPIFIYQKQLSGAYIGRIGQLKEKWNGLLEFRNTEISRSDRYNNVLKFR